MPWRFPQVDAMKKLGAQVVYEHEDGGNIQHGPLAHERVGVRFGSRVFWISDRFLPNAQYGDQWDLDKAFCEELVRRWNAGVKKL